MMIIEAIQNHPIYKQVLKDSCGGLIYDVGKRDSYNANEVIALWNSLEPSEQEAAGGIMKGAISFLMGE